MKATEEYTKALLAGKTLTGNEIAALAWKDFDEWCHKRMIENPMDEFDPVSLIKEYVEENRIKIDPPLTESSACVRSK